MSLVFTLLTLLQGGVVRRGISEQDKSVYSSVMKYQLGEVL